jgi:DNA-binding response OmpR family regulator
MNQKRTILIVDDEPGAIVVLELLLRELNYDVFSTTDSVSAVDTISRLMPELIVLDWNMPERDGIEVLKLVRDRPQFDEIPIIVTTGFRTAFDDLKLALDSGAMDYVKKPVNKVELEARVANAFRQVDAHRKIVNLNKELQKKELEIAEAKAAFLQSELEKKEREMTVVAVSMFQNKDFLFSLRKDLITPDMPYEKRHQQHILKVLDKYDNLSNSLNWQLFEKRFIEIHNDFYTKLRKEFEGLTWSELRLCALFRIGFSLKEVSVLSYSNYDTIRKAVYRMRKKLGISDAVDINLFLQAY